MLHRRSQWGHATKYAAPFLAKRRDSERGNLGVYMRILGKAIGGTFVAATMLVASPASATTTFAQFLQAIPNARIFTYTNVNSVGTKATLGTVGGSNIVVVSDLGTLASPTLATISLVGTSSVLPTVGSSISQLFSGSMVFTLLAPQLGLSGWSTNALKVTFTNAALLAAPGGAAPTLQSSAGSTITYDSDFADLTGVTSEDFSLSFSGSSVPLSMIGSRLPNFRVSGSGTFAAVIPVPEPASWGLMLVGFGLAGATLRTARRRSAAFA